MKLHYFDIYGRADSIRALLHHAKVPFEDVTVAGPAWGELKPKTEFGQLPLLELENGKLKSQSVSILRYLGRQYGYYSSENIDHLYLIDSGLDGGEDFLQKFYRARFENDSEK